MNTYHNKIGMKIFIILCIMVTNPVLLFADDESLRIGIFPRRTVAETEKMFTPLANYLEEQLGYKVSIDVPPDMPAFWSRLEQGKYDLVHLNQYHYVRAHARLGWQAILKNEEFGKDTIAGSLWVLKDSEIQSVSDLQGKLIIFGGGDHAMVASIMTRDILLQAGINEDSYIGMTSLHTMKSIISVYYKQADAAGVGDVVTHIPAIQEKIDIGKLRLLAKSKSLAHLPWAVRADIDVELKEKIVEALLLLNKSSSGEELLNNAGLTGIRQASNADYEEHRKIIKRVLGESY
jgi:phosphonate transport system substrate-binding protein